MCVETKNQGHSIPCYIFPFEMNEKDMNILRTADVVLDELPFWENLATAYQYFTKNKTKVAYTIDKKGKYVVKE